MLKRIYNLEGLNVSVIIIGFVAGCTTLFFILYEKVELSLLWSAIVLICLITILAPVISYLISRWHSKQMPLNAVKQKIRHEITHIKDLTNDIDDIGDLLKLKFIAYRFRLELSKYESMRRGVYQLWCLDSMAYFMYIFRSAMDMLDEGDEYRAVTTAKIWLHDKPIGGGYENVPYEYKKSFLEANREALGRKVKLERFFLIDAKSVWEKGSEENKNVTSVVNNHIDYLGESVKRFNILFCPIENFEEETKKDIAYALIRDASCSSFMYLLSKKDQEGRDSIFMNVTNNNSESIYMRLHEKVEKYRNIPNHKKFTLLEMGKKLGI